MICDASFLKLTDKICFSLSFNFLLNKLKFVMVLLFIVGVSKLFVNHGTTHQQPDLNHLGTGLAGANFFSINFNHPGWRMLAPVTLGWCHGTQSA